MSRDDLIREAIRALHGCLEADKVLDTANTAVAVVGVGETFHLLEAGDLAPFLEGLGAAAPAGGAAAMADDDDGGGAAAGGAAAAGGGAA